MKEAMPPGLLELLLRRVLPPEDRDAMAGDMRELYAARLSRDGPLRARRWYARHSVRFAVRWVGGAVVRRVGDVAEDVRWAVRGMRRRPGFAAVVVVTLAFGIGANSAVFTLVSANLMALLPYERPGELVTIEHEQVDGSFSTVAGGTYLRWKRSARSFVGVAAMNGDQVTVSGGERDAERVSGSIVTPGFFDVLGVRPELGTVFTEGSAREAGGALVVLSHAFWVGRFGGDPGIVGRTVRLDGRPHTVVAVMPASFRQPEIRHDRARFWRPLLLDDGRSDFHMRFLRVIGRLAPGAAVEHARAELAGIADSLAREHPEEAWPFTATVSRLGESWRREARQPLMLLAGASTLLLLLVCTNVANLALARGQERQRDFAVRTALGCRGSRLLQQILVEVIILAAAAAVAGTGVVLVATRGLEFVQERYFSSIVDASVDGRVIGWTGLLAVVAGALSAAPIARTASRCSLRGPMAIGDRRSGWGRDAHALRGVLVASQVALATTLLAVSAILVRSLDSLVSVPPGFDPRGRLTLDLSPPIGAYPEPADQERYFRDIVREIGVVPGVAAVAVASDLPFTMWNVYDSFTLEDRADGSTVDTTDFQRVSPNYFEVMGIPVLRGRVFDDAWRPDENGPVVVSQRLARLLVPDGGDVVGRTIRMTDDTLRTHRIAAVVGDVRDGGYAADAEPMFYMPIGPTGLTFGSLVIRTVASTPDVISGIRAAVSRVDPEVPIENLRSMDAMLASTLAAPLAASRLGAGVAFLALLVAAAGIYGVVSHSVQVRIREIGIRAALGADARKIVSTVAGRSAFLLGVGLMVGLGGALVAGTILSGFLFGVRSWDPPSLGAAVVILGLVGAIAATLPTRRAILMDVSEVLRAD